MSRGFDAFVGNPPFIGGTTIKTRISLAYHHALLAMYRVDSGNVDLVAFFIRRCFDCLRHDGVFGLIATNSVAQGDTRVASLQYVKESGGTIFNAIQRYAWPGESAVVVTLLHAYRGEYGGAVRLNGRSVERITSFLFHRGADTSPVSLRANEGRASCGSQLMGAGFVFEDPPSSESSSLDEMRILIAKDRRNQEVIDPMMGGEEFNNSATLSPIRYAINFRQMSHAEASRWPDVLAIVEAKVKPMRLDNKQRNYREDWWLYASYSHDAARFLGKFGRMLALSQVSTHHATGFVPGGAVYTKTLVLILFHTFAGFALVQSRVHGSWARFVGSSMKDDPRYTPSECFDTFPFPAWLLASERSDVEGSGTSIAQQIEMVGKGCYEHRAGLMVKNNEGLTKTYNRFHNPDERSADIVKLRELHAQMDRAVLDAYGWTDIQPAYDFREQLDESTRLTWDDDTRDEVLARLLELNRVLAEKEAGEASKVASSKPAAKKRGAAKKTKAKEASLALPGVEPDKT